MPANRMYKLNQQFKREIGSMILMGDISDPRLSFVSVTYADISKDLSYAHIGFSVLSDDVHLIKAAQEGLNSASGRVRKLMGERVRVRPVPDIRFVYDDSIARAVSMTQTLNEIRREREGLTTEEGVPDGKEDNCSFKKVQESSGNHAC